MRRPLCVLIPAALLALPVLLLFHLPSILKHIVNSEVLPAKFADPDVPLVSGSVTRLAYNGLTAEGLVADLGNGLLFQIPRVDVDYSPATLVRKEIRSAAATITSGPEIQFEAEVSARDIRISDSGIAATVSAHCPRITADKFSAGPITISTQIDGTDAALAFNVPLQDGLLNAQVQLVADWKTNPVFNVTAHLPLSDADGSPVQLGSLVSGVDDLLVSGRAAARIDSSAEGTETKLSLQIDSLELPANSLTVSNLYTDCTLRSPGDLRSLPEQQLTVERLAAGKLQIDQLRMHYQLEPESVLCIEDLEAEWCDGRISLYNTRVRSKTTHVAAQLFCDHLSLEQVLTACGVKGFSADGELNGRLPAQWKNNELTIARGLLFTTPGRGGTFSFGAAKGAEGILPPGSMQAGQIGLVTAALENFKYDWITMTLNSEGENLKAVVEVAGRPVNILPYEYDPKRGTYVKIEPRKGRGIRQPMRFQLNLTVPLNQLLCYASGVNRQWNLFKTK